MRIAVTGATGYIGQHLIRAALQAGHGVLALSRRPVVLPNVGWRFLDLSQTAALSFPPDIDVVFHLAADTRHAQCSGHDELVAAIRLMDAAAAVGAYFVFISSQTARADAPTAYGRTKWQIECATLAAKGWVVRPGLVYGGPERGLFGELCGFVRRLPVLPAFVPAPAVQPIHVDDLAEALLSCLKLPPSSVINVASPAGIGFTAFLRAIARGRTGSRAIFIPVPTSLIRFAGRILGSRLGDRLGLDRLGSLFALPRMETADDLQRLSLILRPLHEGMTRSGRGRRQLLLEGRALLAYVLRMAPTSVLVRRYVRVVETLRKSRRPLCLPEFILRYPAMLALFDGARCINLDLRNELDWRLNAALMLAEASPQGAFRFLGVNRRTDWLRNSFRIILAVIREAVRRGGQLALRPVLSRMGHRGVFE